jgi:hypothetical protein
MVVFGGFSIVAECGSLPLSALPSSSSCRTSLESFQLYSDHLDLGQLRVIRLEFEVPLRLYSIT